MGCAGVRIAEAAIALARLVAAKMLRWAMASMEAVVVGHPVTA